MPGVAITSPKMLAGDFAAASRPLALSSPNSQAEMGETRIFSSAAPAVLMAVLASGLIGSFNAIHMIAQVSSSSLCVTAVRPAPKPVWCNHTPGEA